MTIAASDPRLSGRARNMKYRAPQVAAIFFMTSFNRDRGAIAPLPPPPDSQLYCLAAGILGRMYILSSRNMLTSGALWFPYL